MYTFFEISKSQSHLFINLETQTDDNNIISRTIGLRKEIHQFYIQYFNQISVYEFNCLPAASCFKRGAHLRTDAV